LSILLLAALGCAGFSGDRDSCPKSIEEVLGDPKLLREQADAALADRDPELAFRYLALVETLHPDSAESQDLFTAAVKLYKRAYLRNRVRAPDSAWMNYEHTLMYLWLSRFFLSPDVFPQQQVDLLFLGMPLNFFDEFAAYAQARPRLFQFWKFEATADDGRVETVTGVPSGRQTGQASGGAR
jgi:hypothetical protein